MPLIQHAINSEKTILISLVSSAESAKYLNYAYNLHCFVCVGRSIGVEFWFCLGGGSYLVTPKRSQGLF